MFQDVLKVGIRKYIFKVTRWVTKRGDNVAGECWLHRWVTKRGDNVAGECWLHRWVAKRGDNVAGE